MKGFRLLVLLALAMGLRAQQPFYLVNGDRVVFYGDSITDQRLYTTFVETYVVTRFPSLQVSFTHSGWGGDKVGGGGGGMVEKRVQRDVAAYNPTVVTIMLGMNDGRYRTFDEAIFNNYAEGYRKLTALLKAQAPGARLTLIRPSPYDDVTREPMAGGGYNAVLVRYGDFLAELAAKEQHKIADLNAPAVAMLRKAHAADKENAARIIPDRVHPGAAGHLIMAGALLKDWGAPALVTDVEINLKARRANRFLNTEAGAVERDGAGLRWTQTDKALPMPVDLEDAVTALAVKSSDFMETLNQQPLRVTGLDPGHYALRIDGQQVGVFTAEAFEKGLNLAALPTPMTRQAAEVHALTLKRANIHNARWRMLEVPLAEDGLNKLSAAMGGLDALAMELARKQREAAQPKPRRYEIAPVPAVMASIPPGFTPIFNGRDLEGWHISQTNHHGTAPIWRVEEGGVLAGGQNPPGGGGILLTDKKYRNFEVYLELNPDWGCDGGLFLRSSERGEAYQVLLDYREGGNVGGIYGERLRGVRTQPSEGWEKVWKKGEWNALRARVTGDLPSFQVWLNGVRITNWADVANHAANGATEGMIAVQVHGGTKIWKEGGFHRFRNIAVRELP